MLYLNNDEHNHEYNIKWDMNRTNGLSAFIRVKNESEFIQPCLLSIKELFDEIIIVLNDSTDKTLSKINALQLPHVKVYQYPFRLHPNGPNHRNCSPSSLRCIAYYYNYALSKTTKTHVCKWDGDMVALPSCYDVLPLLNTYDAISIFGLNLVDKECQYLSKNAPKTGRELRFFKFNPNRYYKQGDMCEVLHINKPITCDIDTPSFLHFKNAKSLESGTAIWPTNYQDSPHFKKLLTRREVGQRYLGIIPEVLQ